MSAEEPANARHLSSDMSPLGELAEQRTEFDDLIALTGYVGVAPAAGKMRLHPSLDDLSISVDIAEADVVATRDAPQSTMPLGGVIVWVSRVADVTFRRTRTVSATAAQVRRFFGAEAVLQPGAGNQRGDRLNIQLRSASAHGVPPVYVPPETCSPCASTNCASHCLPTCTSHV